MTIKFIDYPILDRYSPKDDRSFFSRIFFANFSDSTIVASMRLTEAEIDIKLEEIIDILFVYPPITLNAKKAIHSDSYPAVT